jgi:hypothetical protein
MAKTEGAVMIIQKTAYQNKYNDMKWFTDEDYLKICQNAVIETTWSQIRRLSILTLSEFEEELRETSERGGQGQRYRYTMRKFVEGVKEGKIKIPDV